MPKYEVLKPDSLAAAVVDRFRRAQQHRKNFMVLNSTVDIWFDRVNMAYNKAHELEQLAMFPGLQGYFGLTTMKVNTAVAHLKNKYSHALELPAVLTPSANPDLPPERKQEAANRMLRQLSERLLSSGISWEDVISDDGVSPLVKKYVSTHKDQIKNLMREAEVTIAKQIAAAQSMVMKDQLDTGGWRLAGMNMLQRLVLEPYVCIRAGHLQSTKVQNWQGRKVINQIEDLPHFETLRGIDCYHAPDATNAQTGSFFIQIAERSRTDLVAMLDMRDADGKAIYFGEQIEKVLSHYNGIGQGWIDARSLNGNTLGAGMADGINWDQRPNSTMPVLIHEGTFRGCDIDDYISGLEPEKLYEVEIEIIGNRTIKANLTAHPDNARTYYSTSYSKSSDTYAGTSVAMMLRDRQLEVNVMMAAKNRNAWHSSGPMMTINGGYFSHPEDIQLEPFGMAYMNPKSGLSGPNFGMQATEVRPMFQMLHNEIRATMVLADEECGVPSLFSGLSRGGISQTTLGGAVLEQTNGEKMMDSAIINVDLEVIEPMIKSLYKYNVIYGDFELRGDIDIVGRGINGLKDEELRRRAMQSNIPLLMQTTQAGLTPKPMLEAALRDYYDQTGFDVSSMPGAEAAIELSNINIAPQPQPDARTYVPEPQRYGA